MKRENGLDLMRVIFAIAIIFFHAANPFLVNYIFLHTATPSDAVIASLSTGLGKIGVVLFIIASGAFTLSSSRLNDLRSNNKKTWKRLGIPTLFFSIFYILELIILSVISSGGFGPYFTKMAEEKGASLLRILGLFLKGEASYHTWYLFLLIPLYLMAPFIKKMMEMVGEKYVMLVTVILILWGSISFLTGSHLLNWDLGYAVESVGTFMLGYVLHEKWKGKLDNKAAGLMIGVGIVLLAIQLVLFHVFVADTALVKFVTPDPVNALTIASAAFFFIGFTRLDIKKDFGYLSALTFGVYLIHPFVMDMLIRIFGAIIPGWAANTVPNYLILCLLVTVISFGVTAIYKKIVGSLKKSK